VWATVLAFLSLCYCCDAWFVLPAVRNCTTQPPFNMTLMGEWSANCSTTVNGGNCSATCLPTATGIGYTSVCREGSWLNATGSCLRKWLNSVEQTVVDRGVEWQTMLL
jgi:hypothetical protein